MYKLKNNHKRGFTIVELLIVIVVIGILAAIVALTYSNVAKEAKKTTLKSDLKQASTQLERGYVESGSYDTSTDNLKSSPGNNLEMTSDGSSFCLSATTSPDLAFHTTNTNQSPQPGVCPGHQAPQAGGGGGTELANNTPIQDVTKAQCNALPVYTGSNPSAIRTVTDNRDGTTRNYEIAKLADNNCWMLTNLKLGKTSGTTTLTPANTNITSNFTLPQVGGNNTFDYDNPRVYGPVPGDTSTGATNYGYLYNWSAATAGETRASHPASAGNAPHSICPANWRLPTGGDVNSGVGEFADLDRAFGGTGKSVWSGEPNIANWQHNGPFKGTLAGHWGGSFGGHGDWGYLWSSSVYPDWADGAFYADFYADGVDPGYGNGRDYGNSVRCLLN